MRRYEVVVTVWEDNNFKLRDRIVSDSLSDLLEQVTISEFLSSLDSQIDKKNSERLVDDDIPF